MSLTHAPRLRSPEDYRESLRDGRRVYYRGERVADVTAHEATRHAVEHGTLDYRMAESDLHRDLAVSEDGYSRYFQVPRTADDLLARSALIEAATRAGRTLVVLIKEIGTDALFALLAMRGRLGRPYGERVDAFYERVRWEDLAMCVAQTDVKGDRSLGPSQQANPDAYLRIVERREDGIVVRGAKVHTSASINANELIVLPTRAMGEQDADYAVSFAVPIDTPGLTLAPISRRAASARASTRSRRGASCLRPRRCSRTCSCRGSECSWRASMRMRASWHAGSWSSTASLRSHTSCPWSTRSSAAPCWPPA
jgi:aromatic ring hydroxylase